MRCDRCIVAGVPCHDCRLRAIERADGAVFVVVCNACGQRRDWHAYGETSVRPDFCNACSSTDVEVTQFRVQLEASKSIEPTGRLRVVESENARLRHALRVIADQGDPHNGEVTRRRKDGEPESWASRLAYFTLHPERRRCD